MDDKEKAIENFAYKQEVEVYDASLLLSCAATTTIQQCLKERVRNTPVHETHNAEVGTKMPNIRRSLTITEENDERVQQRRAMFLSIRKASTDMDYTTTVNMFIELGDFLFKQDWTNPNITVNAKEVMNIILKYTHSTTLKEEALFDQYRDYLLSNFPKMVQVYQSVIAAQKQSLPAPQQTEQETPKKGKEYIS